MLVIARLMSWLLPSLSRTLKHNNKAGGREGGRRGGLFWGLDSLSVSVNVVISCTS